MMNSSLKRILFILLVLVGIVGVAATVYFLFLNKKIPVSTPQPTPTPSSELPDAYPLATPQPAQAPLAEIAQPSPDSAAELERKAREALFRRTRDLASRFGSYGNADDYASLMDLNNDSTPEVQTYLSEQRTALRVAHPARGTSFAQTTRALSARLTVDVPVLSTPEVEVIVDAQQRTEDGTSDATVIRQGILKLVKSGTSWNVSHITWQDAKL